MEYTKLGRTGLDVSRLCLGCMSYGIAYAVSLEAVQPFQPRSSVVELAPCVAKTTLGSCALGAVLRWPTKHNRNRICKLNLVTERMFGNASDDGRGDIVQVASETDRSPPHTPGRLVSK